MRADTAIVLLSTFLLTLPCNCNRKDELNKILADFKLEFSPDDNSPVDPIKTLRDAIQAGSQEDAFKKSDIARNKRETVSGVLHGLRVELVNATLVLGTLRT